MYIIIISVNPPLAPRVSFSKLIYKVWLELGYYVIRVREYFSSKLNNFQLCISISFLLDKEEASKECNEATILHINSETNPLPPFSML